MSLSKNSHGMQREWFHGYHGFFTDTADILKDPLCSLCALWFYRDIDRKYLLAQLEKKYHEIYDVR